MRSSLGFVDCQSVESKGESGGLAIIWRKGVEPGVYGPSSVNGRANFWGLMEGMEPLILAFVSKFTWSNKRAGLANVKERLDRDTHLEDNSRARPFRFEAMWTRDATSSQVVQLLQQAWQLQVEESHGFKLAKKDSTSKRQAKRVEQNTVWISKNQNQRVGEEN
nr:hypothetical protein CFP56_45958 [Quercus suber]